MTSITSKNLCLTIWPNNLSLFLFLLLFLPPSPVVVAPTVSPPLPRPLFLLLPLPLPLPLAALAVSLEGSKIVLVDKLIVKQRIKDLNMQKVVHAPAPAACRLLSCFRLLAAAVATYCATLPLLAA